MTEDNTNKENTGIETLDRDIEMYDMKKAGVENLKRQLRSLKDRGVNQIYVGNRLDDDTIHVRVEAQEPHKEMVDIAKMSQYFNSEAINPDRLEFDPETGVYILDRKFRTNK